MEESAFKSYYTVENYIELPGQVDYKIAYHEGEVFAMADWSVNHAQL
jgi:hypothetical protein